MSNQYQKQSELCNLQLKKIQLYRRINIYISLETSMKPQQEEKLKNEIHQKLVDAAGKHNLQQVKQLLSKGANVNYVRYTDSNCWYQGNSHTALYDAVHSDFKGDETNYINVLELLLKSGANPNVYVTRGGWNHSTEYPLFNGVAYILALREAWHRYQSTRTPLKTKNWRAYRNHTCFIFSAMDSGGMGSKIWSLAKSYKVENIDKITNEKERKLRQQFDKQNLITRAQDQQEQQEEEQRREEQVQEQEQSEKQQKNKVVESAFIQALINFGANPNSSRSSSHWENYSEDYDQSEQRISQQAETVLHRAIMNDQYKLVKLLLQKGAKVETPCKFTKTSLIPHSQWSQQLKKKKIDKNVKQFQESERKKVEFQKQLANCTDENDKRQMEQNLRQCQYEIFKAKKFSIQTQCPIPKDQVVSLNSLQIAEKLKVDPRILQLLNVHLLLQRLGLSNQKNPNIVSAFFTKQILPDCDDDLLREAVSLLVEN